MTVGDIEACEACGRAVWLGSPACEHCGFPYHLPRNNTENTVDTQDTVGYAPVGRVSDGYGIHRRGQRALRIVA